MPINSTTITTQLKDDELTSNLNYLQPTGFRVVIDRTRYPNLEYFAQPGNASRRTVKSTGVTCQKNYICSFSRGQDNFQ